jgi:hypothetical protein
MRKTLKFGRLPVKHDERNLQFANYITPKLAPPPSAVDNISKAYKLVCCLSRDSLFPMDGNDKWGDCTVAGGAHAITLFRAMIGQKYVPSSDDVVSEYLKLTGGTDTGVYELDLLNAWRKDGMFGDKILAHVEVNPKNHTHVQQSIQLFGGLLVGMVTTQDCINQFWAHQMWTPGPLTGGLHAVFVANYDPNRLTVLTWGKTQDASWDWWDECIDEAHAILPPEAANNLFQPGFNLGQLQADLIEVTK